MGCKTIFRNRNSTPKNNDAKKALKVETYDLYIRVKVQTH